ncbi:AzlC family ABC transporter permease [Thauera linaloolentis]|uniref:AzlC family protein n=1 Tax=Thauera linaloolentis (strain DSM 12138 / JCM 21573 / CCUG 41526 / CIP 105981 / IAM 15112 / NBRC 102519 / 47Lol) TaxID=1123367 RepID=N6Y373_THAL4|nr:AzlC family ABC transporter permease [Thauera linaloolentis]ENO88656.1 AzlC family protein [Thauera linaloolentis 47Lol = DSM 12138]MCM8565701.1 AzlC family ABC transporter permease [Thauera linaloolentis]
MESAFRRGAREGLRDFLPVSVGLLPWAVVTGIAMRSIGLSEIEALGMNLLVYAGTAQLGSLPLIAAGAPLWLIMLTALALNLRFIIFSAAIAPIFHGQPFARRLASSYLLVDGVFAVGAEKLLKADDPQWRWGYYIVPSVFNWCVWQSCTALGIFGAEFVPRDWSLEFMVTIALMVMMLPMVRNRPMLIAALAGGLGAVLLRGLPLRLGVVAGIVIGIAAGFAAERWLLRGEAA